MNVRKLFSLLVGVVALLAASGYDLAHAFDRAHTLHAKEAVIESDTFVVGTPFAGSIASVSVSPGDTVSAGKELFRIQSPTLQQARNTSRFNAEGVGYRMEGTDTQVFPATADGLQPPTDSRIAPAAFDPQERPVFTGVLSVRLADATIGLRAAPARGLRQGPDGRPP